jgi:hypothetical protein
MGRWHRFVVALFRPLQLQYLHPHSTSKQISKASIKKQKCCGCGGEGHYCRNCPASLPAAALHKAVQKRVVEADGILEASQQNLLLLQHSC